MTDKIGERNYSGSFHGDEVDSSANQCISQQPNASKAVDGPRVIEDHDAKQSIAPNKSELPKSELAKKAGKPHPSVVAARAQREKAQTFYVENKSDDKGASVQVGVIKHKNESSEGEFFTAGVKVETKKAADGRETGQAEMGVNGANVAIKGKHVSGKLEGLSAKVAMGANNPDGSTGINIGASANLAAAEATYESSSGASFTFGASVGAGSAVAVGKRDKNGDGVVEYCARVELGAITIGACIPEVGVPK